MFFFWKITTKLPHTEKDNYVRYLNRFHVKFKERYRHFIFPCKDLKTEKPTITAKRCFNNYAIIFLSLC